MQKSKMQMIESSVHKRIHDGIEKDRVQYEITINHIFIRGEKTGFISKSEQ